MNRGPLVQRVPLASLEIRPPVDFLLDALNDVGYPHDGALPAHTESILDLPLPCAGV